MHFNRAVQINHDSNPLVFTPSPNNPHFHRSGKRRGSKSPSKSARKAAAKREKGEAKSPKKEASSSSSCGPECDFPQPKYEDPPSY